MAGAFEIGSDEIATLCRRHGVRRLDMFGSAARGEDFRADSDIDLAIDYDADRPAPRWSEFLALREAFGRLFGRRVDLVMNSAIRNPYIRDSIDRTRRRLYGT